MELPKEGTQPWHSLPGRFCSTSDSAQTQGRVPVWNPSALWCSQVCANDETEKNSDMWGIGVTLFLFGFRFLQCRWWCFGSFLPALGNPSQLVVLFPKLSQFLTLLLQFIFQL